MPHEGNLPCMHFWGFSADELMQHISPHNEQDPAGGWAYWLEREQDFDDFVHVYEMLLIALDQASDEPGPWALNEPTVAALRPPVPSLPLGDAARLVAAGLTVDGHDFFTPGVFSHPQFGNQNWLQMAPTWDSASIEKAGDLLLAMRNALDR